MLPYLIISYIIIAVITQIVMQDIRFKKQKESPEMTFHDIYWGTYILGLFWPFSLSLILIGRLEKDFKRKSILAENKAKRMIKGSFTMDETIGGETKTYYFDEKKYEQAVLDLEERVKQYEQKRAIKEHKIKTVCKGNDPIQTFYISFGQAHTHNVKGKFYHKDVLCKVYAKSKVDARAVAENVFEGKYAIIYDENSVKIQYFPGGVVEL